MRRLGHVRTAHAAGFTLLELLVVMAIIAIVAGVFFVNLTRTIRQNEVRDAAYQLIGDLRQARSAAQRTGQVGTVTITPSLGTYTVQGYSAQAGKVVVTPRTLPHGVTVQNVSGSAGISYQPPYGTLGVDGPIWAVQSPAGADLVQYVNVVGVTGKVMLSATRK